MRKVLLIIAISCAGASPLWALDETSDDAASAAEGEADAGYVVREEKVVNFETGKVEVEKVIEFPELEILPELARPVEIIIPRTEPDFDKMPFTIYNNEPSSSLPEEYRQRYYRRAPVGDVRAGDMYKAAEAEDDAEEAQNDGGG
jgi:hypothetical protein